MSKLPLYLKPGDTIAIVSTASKIDEKIVRPAIDLLKSMGYNVKLGKHIFAKHNQFAGTDLQRTSDLQAVLNDDEVSAIVCSRGGYGTLRVLQNINWSAFIKKPKWVIGFSDITVLHSQLNQFSIPSIHGVMPRFFVEDNKSTISFNYLHNALIGKQLEYTIETHSLNRFGKVSAEIVGGNLSILYNLRGTDLDVNTKNKILFIEDLGEYLYHLDRIMMNLKIGGKLKELKGLVVGGFTGMKDHDNKFGMTVEEIVMDAVSDYHFPVMFNFPAGHQKENYPIILGSTATIEIWETKATFKQCSNVG